MDNIKLSDEDDSMMLWARKPYGLGYFKLARTPELETAFLDWKKEQCTHTLRHYVLIRAKNDADMFRMQCQDCALPLSQWIKRSSLPDGHLIPEVHPDANQEYEQRRLEKWRIVQARHAISQLARDKDAYSSYLRSREWQEKRAQVFMRAAGLCEGCREREATQVHHLTYEHVGDELLWELVAVCDACHSRVHVEPDRE